MDRKQLLGKSISVYLGEGTRWESRGDRGQLGQLRRTQAEEPRAMRFSSAEAGAQGHGASRLGVWCGRPPPRQGLRWRTAPPPPLTSTVTPPWGLGS